MLIHPSVSECYRTGTGFMGSRANPHNPNKFYKKKQYKIMARYLGNDIYHIGIYIQNKSNFAPSFYWSASVALREDYYVNQ